VGTQDHDILSEYVEVYNSNDLTLYQRQQLMRSLTLYVSGNLGWAMIILDWLRGEPDIEYYG
jgi:hypothetical protein